MSAPAKIKAKPKRVMRPTNYDPIAALKIAKRMANGETVRVICQDKDMPDFDVVYNWLDKIADFRDAFSRARVIGTHNLAEECLELAANAKLDPEMKRIMISTRIKLIAQWNRKDYADRMDETGMARVTLGELIEASYQRIADGKAPPVVDITPKLDAPRTDDVLRTRMDEDAAHVVGVERARARRVAT